MRKVFKVSIIMILAFALYIPMQITVKASTYKDMASKKNVAVGKPWIVSFNKPLNANSVNTTNIKLVGESNKYIDIKVTLANGNKSVIVQPVKNYEYNKTYTLIVTQKVICEDGQPLAKEVRMVFNTNAPPTKPNEITVCIDAAQYYTENTGKGGTKAKDINLSTALKLGNLLKTKGFNVVYTRSSDSVPWSKINEDDAKATIAKNEKADIYLSVNTNSASNIEARGIETYYMPDSSSNKLLASSMQAELLKATGAKDRGIQVARETANFEILKKISCPSIVLELGFLSNAEEEVLLSSEEYQSNAAKAMANGLMNYAGFKNTDINYDSVLKISSVQDIRISLEAGGKYIFPKTVKATMNDNSKKEVEVQWPQDMVYLTDAGTYAYEGTIKNFDKKVKVIVEVSKKQISKFIVCINAARGGTDSGSVGPTGLKEKEVNLDVALRLGKLLEKENVQVVYTRSSDSVTWNSVNEIQERINIANNAKADLLVTISCNSVEDEASNGIRTYYLNGNDKSKQLAEYIQEQLVSKTGALDRRIIGSDLSSLKQFNAPGVMATLGFITNKSEESKLNTSEYKDNLAAALTNAVVKYISVNPKGASVVDTGILGSIYVSDIMVNIKKGDNYSFPSRINGTKDNGEQIEVDVVWDSKVLDTSKVGVYTFLGTIAESAVKVNLAVNVIEITKQAYKVVIDPGHGARDPGAIGTMGTKEKEIVLKVSFKVGNILVKNGVETVYTRISDNIPWYTSQAKNLQQKCDVSNNANPDYFVSIHANAFSLATVSGIETYYASGNAEGAKIAQAVQTELIKETGRVDRKIKDTKGLYVLNNTNATAILVETSFLSNLEEEALLGTDEYQDKLAKAISTGILKSLGITDIVY
jgi:N-acetylmuramoyl-L-alanine amidase